MGLLDKAKQAQEEARVGIAATHQAAAVAVAACPAPKGHYVTEVNRGSINMAMWAAHLNDMYGNGYRLDQVFEQAGNTVQVYVHHFHP